MKIVQINSTCGAGSTGKICVGISRCLSDAGIENYVIYSLFGSDYPLGIRTANGRQIKLQSLKSHILGNYGFNSASITKRIIGELELIKPDAVQLHNLHSHDCNLEMLFKYLKSRKIKLFWTFHDCWAFTGYCTHFMKVDCKKWQHGCEACPLYREYSWFFDNSKKLYEKKKALFDGLDLTVIVPSEWMGGLVKQSFLKDYPVKVINNGIDLSAFAPSPSDFRQRHNISADKKVVLGVAFNWSNAKGLDAFIELAGRLNGSKYQVVLVGTDSGVDSQLPESIISIHRTSGVKELAEAYSAADIFVNPTKEDTFPTVNIEALACGTPVITYNTGGSPEIINSICGSVVNEGNVDALEKEIIRVCADSPYSRSDCLSRAMQFNQTEKFQEYVELYKITASI